MTRSWLWIGRLLLPASMLLLCLAPGLQAQTEIINTVAGNGVMGYTGDGVNAVSAELSIPVAVALDKAGNLFIADMVNNRVRRVDQATRTISTVAGNGIAGYSGVTGTGVCPNNGGSEPGDGGLATSACLYNPSGLAVDKAGNIFIADFGNRRIRKVNTAGIITTVAGGGTTCPGDGLAATAACLTGPSDVVVDGSGNLYISDVTDARIRKVTATNQIITTVAGNGASGYSGDGVPATSTRLWSPRGVALDSSGNIYIADSGNERVRKVTASTGIIATIAGNGTQGYSGAGCPANGGLEPGDGGAATAACLSIPSGVAITGGQVYIADTFNNRIRVVQNGIIKTVAGGTLGGGFLFCGDGKPALNACLYHPTGVAVGSISTSNVYVADSLNNRIRYAYPGICSSTSCSAIPINYHQVGPGVDQGGGVLFFNYAWQSSDGYLADLGNCWVGELVTYPGTANPYVYANPPYAFGDSSPNPTILWGSVTAAEGKGTDKHSPKPFMKPYVFNSFTAKQNYRYTCLGLAPVNFPGWVGIQLTRTVRLNATTGCWTYTVTKSGYSASLCLP
jgi:sugar lactone lactonase YvrE